MRTILTWVAAAFLSMAATGADASTVYDETAIPADLPGTTGAVTASETFNLSSSSSVTVIGTVGPVRLIIGGSGQSDSSDTWKIIATDAFEVDLAAYAPNFNGSGNSSTLFSWYDSAEVFQNLVSLSAPTTNIFGEIAAGTYFFQVLETDAGNATAKYELQFKASGSTNPIPLPAGLPLLLAGIGALGLLKRRSPQAA